jgi:hypothetical protein
MTKEREQVDNFDIYMARLAYNGIYTEWATK